MKFPVKFSRWKGAGQPASVPILLGADAVPSTQSDASKDCVLMHRTANANGWPAQRIAIVYSPPSGTTDLTASLYAYETNTGKWYRVGPAGFTLSPGKITYVDSLGIIEPPATGVNMNEPTSGGVQMFLCVSDNGAPNGEHVFAMGADITATEGPEASAGGAATEGTLSALNAKFPAASAPADGKSNATTSTEIQVRPEVYNGTTWDMIRGSLVGVVAFVVTSFAGFLHVLGFGRYAATRPTLADGNGTHTMVNQRGDQTVAEQYQENAFANSDGVCVAVIKKIPNANYSTKKLVEDFGATVTKNAKTTQGVVSSARVANRNAGVRYLQLHNTATTPAGGATPALSIPIEPTGPTGFLTLDERFFGAQGFCPGTTGIAYAWSSSATTYTAATAAEHDTVLMGA